LFFDVNWSGLKRSTQGWSYWSKCWPRLEQ